MPSICSIAQLAGCAERRAADERERLVAAKAAVGVDPVQADRVAPGLAEVGNRIAGRGGEAGEVAVLEHKGVGAGPAGADVLAGAASERVGAAKAGEAVGCGVAGEAVGAGIAGAVDRRAAGQRQILDLVPKMKLTELRTRSMPWVEASSIAWSPASSTM